MARVFLSIGTNLGNKSANLEQAILLLSQQAGSIVRFSDPFESQPWGFDSENNFMNNVVELQTDLAPLDLLHTTQTIEKQMGRAVKTVDGYADRIIDIDILFYDNLVVDLPELKIPHPLAMVRDFVYVPMKQIAPAFVHPVSGETLH